MRHGEPVDPDALPAPVRRAVARVQADIRATTSIPWDWVFENDPDPEGRAVRCIIGTARGGFGVAVRWDTDEEDAAAYLADEWSEEVCETLAEDDAELARRWPPCPKPGHEHALDPELRAERAVWVCRDRTVVAV